MVLQFMAYIKKFSKKNLVSLDSEIEITLRTNDMSIIEKLNRLSQPDKYVIIKLENNET